MNPPELPHARAAETRIARAVAAQLRQEFDPFIRSMQDDVAALLGDAEQRQEPAFVEIIDSLRMLQTALERLQKRIEAAVMDTANNIGDSESEKRHLRHDLNNLLGGIKGLGEYLVEEFAELDAGEQLTILEALVQKTEQLRDRLVRIVRYSAQTATDTPEADLVKAVIASITPPEVAPGMGTAGQAGQSTLLVVDDDEINQSVIRRKLEREGYRRVETVSSGSAALQRLERIANDERSLVDLILLDLLMPDMNGYQVLHRLKSESRWHDIPVIIISAWDDLESIARCIEAGAEDYLVKPFEPALLRARIGSALEKRRLRQREQELQQREIDQAIQIQRSLMSPPAPDGSPIDGRNRPIRYVSGDYFEHFRRADGTIPFALADVSGKGFDAALLMAKMSGLFRYLSKREIACGELLAILNREFYDRTAPGRFVTAVVGFFDPATNSITFANAGHVPPILIAPDQSVRSFPASAPPLGVLPEIRFTSEAVVLAPGDALYVFSDGFIECRRPDGEELAMEGFIPFLQQLQSLSLKARLDRLFAQVTAPGWQTHDDLTMLAIVPG